MYCSLELNREGNVRFIENNTIQSQEEWNRPWTRTRLTYALIKGTEDLEGDGNENKALGIALQTWATEVDLKFDRVKSTENPDIRIEFRTSQQEKTFKDRPQTLAFAYMPGQGSVSGQVVFNEDYEWSMHGRYFDGKRTWNLIHVMIHELGHTLGLLHDEHSGTADVMDPFYNREMLDLSDWDIIRIRQMYKIRDFNGIWSRYERLKRWMRLWKRRF